MKQGMEDSKNHSTMYIQYNNLSLRFSTNLIVKVLTHINQLRTFVQDLYPQSTRTCADTIEAKFSASSPLSIVECVMPEELIVTSTMYVGSRYHQCHAA